MYKSFLRLSDISEHVFFRLFLTLPSSESSNPVHLCGTMSQLCPSVCVCVCLDRVVGETQHGWSASVTQVALWVSCVRLSVCVCVCLDCVVGETQDGWSASVCWPWSVVTSASAAWTSSLHLSASQSSASAHWRRIRPTLTWLPFFRLLSRPPVIVSRVLQSL